MANQPTSTHSTACRAYAAGMGVENIRDAALNAESAEWAAAANPVREGDAYLETDPHLCICARTAAVHAQWILPGLAALDADRASQ